MWPCRHHNPSRYRVLRDDRGVALIITVMVVAFLTIIVTELTFSAQVHYHMSRNALSRLQASLLARSGINLAEAYLLSDEQAEADGYIEPWGLIDVLESGVVLPENMRLRVQIYDETGKFDLNRTFARHFNEWRNFKNAPSEENNRFAIWQIHFGRLLELQGEDPQLAEVLTEYQDYIFTTYFNEDGQIIQQEPETEEESEEETEEDLDPLADRPPRPADVLCRQIFSAPDDIGSLPGFHPRVLQQMRPVLTVFPCRQGRFGYVRDTFKININTAPRTVLDAIIDDASVVEEILDRRQEALLRRDSVIPLIDTLNGEAQLLSHIKNVLGDRSYYFVIRASAVVNPDPETGRGGVRQTVSLLVRRQRDPNTPRNTPQWILTRLDWQKEGGAALFTPQAEEEFLARAQMARETQ